MNGLKTSLPLWVLIVVGISLSTGSFTAGYYYKRINISPENNQISSDQNKCSQLLDVDGIGVKIGELRLANNRENFVSDHELAKYAQARADEIAAAGVLTHETKYTDYFSWADSVHSPEEDSFKEISEELTGIVKTPCEAEENFKNSPTHLEGILRESHTRAGFGVKDGYVVIILGEPK